MDCSVIVVSVKLHYICLILENNNPLTIYKYSNKILKQYFLDIQHQEIYCFNKTQYIFGNKQP